MPDAWHPEDALFAPLCGTDGELVGIISVDLPRDGLHPGRFQREMLEMYAVQASTAIRNARQRVRLVDQVRLADAIREIAQLSGRHLDVGQVLDDSIAPIVAGLRCDRVAIWAFDDEDDGPRRGRGARFPDSVSSASDAVVRVARRVVDACWARRCALVVSTEDTPQEGAVPTHETEPIRRYLDETGAESALLVPLDGGTECVGYLALTRLPASATWTDDEIVSALEVGRDLGRFVLHARLFARERRLVQELQALDSYRSELFATISHEVKNPLTAIAGHTELLRDEAVAAQQFSLRALERSTRRLGALVEDLLLLAKVADPKQDVDATAVDMVALLHEAAEMLDIPARQQGVTIQLGDAPATVTAWGDPAQLASMVENVIGKAVKYSPDGGTVRLDLERDSSTVTFRCRDEGLGISKEDQSRLFTEFYRSSNPRAIAQPGTGLGLSIVKRIVERHGGSLRLDSRLGAGSTFTITIPAHGGAGREAVEHQRLSAW